MKNKAFAVLAAIGCLLFASGAFADQPVDWQKGFQPAATSIMEEIRWFEQYTLWFIVPVTLFVLALLIIVVVKFRESANPVPSKTSHNTIIEIVWTVGPVIILLFLAIPSFQLLTKQLAPTEEPELTLKATGYQWYWGYGYPDNGGFEVISNMLPEEEAEAKGLPSHLAVDNRMVVPVDTPLRIQTTAADVIHAFAVPALWFKIDAVPGRLNERLLTITEPGIYYGQCSELCGARHGYMPIAVEALPRDQWEAWVRSQPGGTVGEAEPAAADPMADAAATAGGDDAAADADAEDAEAAAPAAAATN